MKTRFRLLIVGSAVATALSLLPSAEAASSSRHCLPFRDDPISCAVACYVQHVAGGDIENSHECQSA